MPVIFCRSRTAPCTAGGQRGRRGLSARRRVVWRSSRGGGRAVILSLSTEAGYAWDSITTRSTATSSHPVLVSVQPPATLS